MSIGLLVGVGMAAVLLCVARAQETQIGVGSSPATINPAPKQGEPVIPNAAPPQAEGANVEQQAGGTTQFPAGVEEVLKMLRVGVATNVIKAYIGSSSSAYSLSAADIIALKKLGVPDELTSAMVERGSKLKAQVSQSTNVYALPPFYAVGNHTYGMLDPEGYDYFQYYYLYPRTLAYANQRLYAPFGGYYGYAPYAYGFYGPRPFHPLPLSALRHP